jgi:NAD(P)H-quinone oxidoreductase subunit 5
VNDYTLTGIINKVNDLIHFSCCLVYNYCCYNQSAIYPFHRWLLSAMTAPTNFGSHHAGFVNGSGILFTLFQQCYLLQIAYSFFNYWRLNSCYCTVYQITSGKCQSKSCSTIAQMGFMIMQCGLGFLMQLVHLILHGFYKAYLFFVSWRRDWTF